jgi:long-chain acyl-CoA synthetase
MRPQYSYARDSIADIAPRSAAAFGRAPALGMADGQVISYEELDRLSFRAAALLAASGLGKGDRAAILSESRPEWGIASLGIARSGAISVPILVDFPAPQVLNILEHSGARALFASAKTRRKLEGAALPPGLAVLSIEELSLTEGEAAAALDRAAEGYAPPPVSSSDLAAIVYTSGTTGLSKGVMLSHGNYLADALACDSVVRLDERDLLLSILPMAHAYEYTIGFLIPMMSGAQIRYLDRPPSASVLMPALAALRPSIMLSVPLVIEKVYRSAVKPSLEKIGLYRIRLFKPLLERLAGRKLYASFGGRMRFFGIGGAPLDPEVEAFLVAARFPYAIGYGLTETAPIIAAAAVGRTSPRITGLPLAGAEIRIVPVDEAPPQQGRAPIGRAPAGGRARPETGEIQVRGPMVFPGYYRDPERSAAAMTEDGFFRTGDLGSFDSRGRLSVRGRIKTMILGASGENIYPEEVEAIVNSAPEVVESLVYGDDEGLVALVHISPETIAQYIGASAKAAYGAAQAAAEAGLESAEKAVAVLLERIKRESNAHLSAFSRLKAVRLQDEPFEKTPTQKIKRFLYPRR